MSFIKLADSFRSLEEMAVSFNAPARPVITSSESKSRPLVLFSMANNLNFFNLRISSYPEGGREEKIQKI